MDKPKCRFCNKTLIKNWYGTDWATEHFGREPLETKPATYDPNATTGFYGTYGKDAAGYFCSYKCGWKWGVATLRGIDSGKMELHQTVK
jgi:hypothetical protein